MSEVQVIHELIKPFKYTAKNSGEEKEAQFVELREPSVRNLSACGTLKQAFMRVIASESNDSNAPESDEDKTDEVPMATKIINALYASDTDITVVLLSAKELFKDVAFVDGEKRVTVPMLDCLSMEDIELMTGKYMENFILASVLKDQ